MSRWYETKVIARALIFFLGFLVGFGIPTHSNGQDTLEITPDLFFIGALQDTINISLNVPEDSSWAASTSDTWLSLDQTSGVGDTVLTVYIGENLFPQIRRDTIFVNSTVLSEFALVIQDPFVCPSIGGLGIDSVSPSMASLSWDSLPEAGGYFLRYRLENSAEPWTLVDTLMQNRYILPGLKAATSYEVQVQTQCLNSQASWSNSVVFSTEDPCAPPPTLNSTILPDQRVELTWTAYEFAIGYEYRYRKVEDTEWVVSSTLSGIKAVLRDLDLNTLYEWQVRSVCSTKTSIWTESQAFAILTCDPPALPSVDSVEYNQAWLSWEAAVNAVQYGIRVRLLGETDWIELSPVGATARVLDGLESDTTYQWQLRTQCSADRSEWVSGPNFKTLPLPGITLVQPKDSSVIRLPFSLKFLVKNWEVKPEGKHIQLFIDDGIPIHKFDLDSISFTSLSEGEHKLKLQLANPDSSLLPFKDSIRVEVLPTLVLELAPDVLNYPYQGDTLSIGINSNSNWAFAPSSPGILISPGSGQGQDSILVGLGENLSVKEYRDTLVVESEGRRDSAFLIQEAAPCAPPIGLALGQVGTNQANLEWNQVIGAESYFLRYRRTGTSEPWILRTPINTNQFVLDNLSDRTSYTWQVRIDCGVFLSAWSELDTFRTEEICPAPENLMATIGEDSSILLSWGVNAFARAFQVRYRQIKEEAWIVGDPIQRIDTQLTNLAVNVDYVWQVRSFCQESFSPWSQEDSFFIFSCGLPTELAADSITDSTAILSWAAGINAQLFSLRYREIGVTIWNRIDNLTDEKTNLDNLDQDTEYEWEVQTICTEDSSSWQTGPNFTTTGPPFIAILSPTDSAKVGNPFNLRFALRNWALSENGRGLRFFVNGADSGAVFSETPILIENLPNGFHTLAVQLQDSAENLISARDTVVVQLIPDPILFSAPQQLFFPARGDSFQVMISSDIAWEFNEPATWLQVMPAEGNGDDTLGVVAQANPEFEERKDTLIVSGGALNDSILVVQAAATCEALQNQRVSNIQDTSALLSWAASVQAINYVLRYKVADSGSNWIEIDTLSLPKVQLLDLLADTPYWWQVRSNCGPVLSEWSDTSTFQTLLPCVSPEGLQVDSLTNTSVRISWSASALASAYFVRYRIQGNSAWVTLPGTADTSMLISNLELDTQYEWEVRSSCEANFSQWVPGDPFRTLFRTPGCGVPVGLQVEGITDTSAAVSWAPVDSATQYEVRYRPTGQSVWFELGMIASRETLLAPLSSSTQYEWAVRVMCSDSLSEWSETEMFETLRDPNITCEPPASTQSIFVSDSTVRFVWSNVDNVLYYELRYRLVTDTLWNLISPLGSNETVVSDLLPDSLYLWQVRAICFVEEPNTPWTLLEEFTIPGPNLDCPQPFNPNTETQGVGSIRFSWIPASGATFYRFRYRVMGTNVWTLIDSIDTNTLLLSNLDPGTTYQWEVGSLCGDIVSFWSEGPMARTWIRPVAKLIQPIDSVVIQEGDSLLLKAEGVDEDGTISAIAFFSNGSLLNQEFDSDSASYNWRNIPRGFYQVFVEVTDNDGLSSTSDTVTVIVGFDPNNVILAEFEVTENKDCAVDSTGLLVTDASVGAASYAWSFGEGAVPETATTAGPHRVRYQSSGFKTISLQVQNQDGVVDIEEKTIEVFITPPKPFAGLDTTICEGGFTMRANPVEDGVGAWELLAGNAVFEDQTAHNTRVTGLRMGTNVFTWRAISGTCESAEDTVVIRRIRCAPITPTEIAGPDTLCIGTEPASFVFSVPADTSVDKYIWITPQGITGEIDSNTLVLSSFSGNGGLIQVIAENEVGQSEPVSKFVAVDSCKGGSPGIFGLIDFTAFLKGDQVVLDWTVGFDQQIASYRIEKSFDSVMFSPIDTVLANQQNLEELKYRTTDDSPFEGMVFYRLVVIDQDGNVVLVRVIKLQLGIDVPPGEVSIYPNPLTQSNLNLAVEAIQSGELHVIITSATSQIIYDQFHPINAGFNNIILDASDWPTGIFYVFAMQVGTSANYGFKVQKSIPED